MTKQNRDSLKKYFQTGSTPTQSQFADLIDSGINQLDDLITVTSGNLTVSGTVSAKNIEGSGANITEISAANVQGGLANANLPAGNIEGQLTSGQLPPEAVTADAGGNVKVAGTLTADGLAGGGAGITGISATSVQGNLSHAQLPAGNITGDLAPGQLPTLDRLEGRLTVDQVPDLPASKITGLPAQTTPALPSTLTSLTLPGTVTASEFAGNGASITGIKAANVNGPAGNGPGGRPLLARGFASHGGGESKNIYTMTPGTSNQLFFSIEVYTLGLWVPDGSSGYLLLTRTIVNGSADFEEDSAKPSTRITQATETNISDGSSPQVSYHLTPDGDGGVSLVLTTTVQGNPAPQYCEYFIYSLFLYQPEKDYIVPATYNSNDNARAESD